MGFCGPILGFCVRNMQPNIKPRGAGIIMIVYGLLVLVLGIYLLMIASNVVEVKIRYDNSEYGVDKTLKVDVPDTMKAPVFLYINLVNFYQNHRAMISSYSRKQLEDKGESESNLRSICKGAVTNREMGKTMNFNNTITLNPDAIASPCGFLAKSFPLDDYKSLTSDKGEIFIVGTTGLIMQEEREKFQPDNDVPQWVKVDNDRFINWMKSASTSNFYKLWGRIDKTIPPGTYTLKLDNLMNPKDSYEGEKYFVMSTANKFGGKKYTPGVFCIIMGAVMLIVGGILVYLWISPVKPIKETPLLIDDGY